MTSRQSVVSSFTVVKGAMIDETYRIFANWDFETSKRENLDLVRAENTIGASSATWLRDVAKVVNRRFDPDGRDRALVQLARSGCDIREWKPILLWHMTRDEFLVRDFIVNWLFPAYADGAFRLAPAQVMSYLAEVGDRGGQTEHPWSAATTQRVAAGLLRIAVDFGLLRGARGGRVKEFGTYHLPERSFLYLLHAMRERRLSPNKIVNSPDWRLFLLQPSDVEQELYRLHQFRQLDYQRAGSIVQLSLPCKSSSGYAERMVA